jgi:hypothetical protein
MTPTGAALRPSTLWALAGASLLCLTLACGSASAARHACQFKGLHQVRANSEAVVLRSSDGQEVYGCTYKAGGRIPLTSTGEGRASAPALLAGHYAATIVRTCSKYDENGCTDMVAVYNLNTREELGRGPDDLALTDLVLRANGSVASIGAAGSNYIVSFSDGAGTRQVDEGPGITPGSLALVGARVYWLRDGAAQVGTLG